MKTAIVAGLASIATFGLTFGVYDARLDKVEQAQQQQLEVITAVAVCTDNESYDGTLFGQCMADYMFYKD